MNRRRYYMVFFLRRCTYGVLIHEYIDHPTSQYPDYHFGCSHEHSKVCSEALITEIVPRNPCHVHGASDYSRVVIANENLRCSYTPFFKNHLIPVFYETKV